jgi:transcription antitermination factor NusG
VNACARENAIAMSSSWHTNSGVAVPPEGSGGHAATKWYALAVKPRHEKSVHRLLQAKNQETFLPLYGKHHRYARREKVFHLPWFPGYLFCRFNLEMSRPVITTPGVIRVLGTGRGATPVDDSEIASLKLAAQAQTAVAPWPFLQGGERIRISEGALAGMEGTVIHVKNEPRIILSVTLLQRSVLLEIDRHMVTQPLAAAVAGQLTVSSVAV